MQNSQNHIIPIERIQSKIYLIRGKKVMLDRDLATLYDVQTKVLNQAVTRNLERFPEDFMFQLTKSEFDSLRSQIVTLEGRGKYPKYLPRAFSEQGVAMLSSVLKSKRAILVNIQIIRTFTKLRELIAENDGLKRKLEAMERHYDEQFKVVFDAIKRLLASEQEPQSDIGFKAD